jgi:cation diffusion facilitator family transporter
VVANAWHHRSDAFSSVAVVLGVGAAMIRPDWHILDACAELLVAILVAKVGVDIGRQAIREMIDTAPDQEVVDAMRAVSVAIEGVEGAHDLKVRSSGGLYHVQIHVEVDGEMTVAEGHAITVEVTRRIRERFPETAEVIVHLDDEDDAELDPHI